MKRKDALAVLLQNLVSHPDPMPAAFTQENLERWSKYNMRPVFFPGLAIHQEFKAEGYVKLNSWFYQSIQKGSIGTVGDLAPTVLKKGWYLADFTPSVDYSDGTQMFPEDPFESLIARLRLEKKIGGRDEKTPAGSRFSITHDEWMTVVCPAIAQELGFAPSQVRLERAIEFNFIGNLYNTKRGTFNTWEWFEDPFGGSNRLCGGNRDNGGLTNVDHYWSDDRHGYIAGRPLVSFVP